MTISGILSWFWSWFDLFLGLLDLFGGLLGVGEGGAAILLLLATETEFWHRVLSAWGGGGGGKGRGQGEIKVNQYCGKMYCMLKLS